MEYKIFARSDPEINHLLNEKNHWPFFEKKSRNEAFQATNAFPTNGILKVSIDIWISWFIHGISIYFQHRKIKIKLYIRDSVFSAYLFINVTLLSRISIKIIITNWWGDGSRVTDGWSWKEERMRMGSMLTWYLTAVKKKMEFYITWKIYVFTKKNCIVTDQHKKITSKSWFWRVFPVTIPTGYSDFYCF